MSCITVTAKRDNLRLISVVMKAPNSQVRNAESKQLLEYGFSMFEQKTLLPSGTPLDTLSLPLAEPSTAQIITLKDASLVYKKGEDIQIVEQNIHLDLPELPYDSTTQVGELELVLSNQTRLTIPLGVDIEMAKVSYFDLFLMLWKQMLA